MRTLWKVHNFLHRCKIRLVPLFFYSHHPILFSNIHPILIESNPMRIIQVLKKKPFLGAMPELLEKARRPQPLPVKLEKSFWPPTLSLICLLLVFFASIALVEFLQGTYYILFFPGNDLVFVNNVAALVIQMLGLIICDLILFEGGDRNAGIYGKT